MTTNYHTPIVLGSAANAATFNSPMSELDTAIDNIIDGAQAIDHLLLAEISTPSTPAAGNNALYTKSDANPYLLDDAGNEGLLLPKRAKHFHTDSTVTNGNAIATTIETGQMYNMYSNQNTPADADSFTFGVLLAAGTYTAYFRGIKETWAGIIDWTIDGAALVTGQDWYNGTQVLNQEQTSGTFSVSAGWHVVTGTVNGKNASSSNYGIPLTDIMFKQAAD